MNLEFSSLELINRIILPVIVSVLAYIFLLKRNDFKDRKKYSRLGVAIINSLIEEIEKGIHFFEYVIEIEPNKPTKIIFLPPKKSWYGMETIPNDVLLEIIEVSNAIKPQSFPPSEIRIHCKNYFEHMIPNIEKCIDNSSMPQERRINCLKEFALNGKYLEASKNVLQMLKQTKELLEKNSKKLIPK